MRAIILAAGRGERLAGFNPDGRPKCLLTIGGYSLLERELRLLADNGIARVEIVVGYQADRVVAHVDGRPGMPEVGFHHNPDYLLGSALSLHVARAAMTGGGRVLVMDADVLFHPAILRRLCRSVHRNCFLLDRQLEPGEEPVKIAVRGGRMVEFRKQLAPDLQYDALGESVGFFSFADAAALAVADACARYAGEGPADTPHEEALRDVLLEHPQWFGFEDVTGLPWIELDFPADVERAKRSVLPAIRQEIPDF
jgi:choline kinase